MWEDLKVYKQLSKKDIHPTFKKFGKALLSALSDYQLHQTNSVIKLSRQINQLEQAIFIEKESGSFELKVRTSIKPIDFYKRHKFVMLNIVPLGDILNNYRKTFYPLTQEWNELAFYLTTRIKKEINQYFKKYDSYDKIIERRTEIEPKNAGLDNKYELLIYASIKKRNKELLSLYLDKKTGRPAMQISQTEFLKAEKIAFIEIDFLESLKPLAQTGDFTEIEKQIGATLKLK